MNNFSSDILNNFLKAIIEDKIPINNLINKKTYSKIENSFMGQGKCYVEHNGIINFDSELDELLDIKTKNHIIKQNKSQLLNDSLKKKNLSVKERQKIEMEFKNFRNKSLVISLIFLNLLSEISYEKKEKAELLYKAFKEYFILLEANHTTEKERYHKKIEFYKELCKTILSQEQDTLSDIDIINDVLFSNVRTEKNLSDHKDLIRKLLKMVQDKSDEIYLLTSEIEILQKELRYWIFDYEALKHNKVIRVNITF